MKRIVALLLLMMLVPMVMTPQGTVTRSTSTGAATKSNVYILGRKTALVASTEKLTVQLSAAPTKTIHFLVAYVYCSVACEITVSRDGAAATATALAPVKINSWSPATTASGYRSSDVGAGTTINPGVVVIGAGSREVLDLSKNFLNAASSNLSVGTNSITGDVVIDIQWEEI